MLLADTKEEENPGDIFKQNRIITKNNRDNLDKALTKAFIDPNGVCKDVKRGRTEKRWSETEIGTRSKGRYSENIK